MTLCSMYFNDVNIALGLMFAAFSGAGSAPLDTPLKFSTPAFFTLATWCHVFHYRVFHPCHLVPRFPLPRFPPLLLGATFSTTAFSTLVTWCHVFHSRVFHPCYLVPRFPLPRFPPLLLGATFSTPAFSTLATWCHVFHSRVFHPCHLQPRLPLARFPPLLLGAAFSTPAYSTPAFSAPTCLYHTFKPVVMTRFHFQPVVYPHPLAYTYYQLNSKAAISYLQCSKTSKHP